MLGSVDALLRQLRSCGQIDRADQEHLHSFAASAQAVEPCRQLLEAFIQQRGRFAGHDDGRVGVRGQCLSQPLQSLADVYGIADDGVVDAVGRRRYCPPSPGRCGCRCGLGTPCGFPPAPARGRPRSRGASALPRSPPQSRVPPDGLARRRKPSCRRRETCRRCRHRRLPPCTEPRNARSAAWWSSAASMCSESVVKATMSVNITVTTASRGSAMPSPLRTSLATSERGI